MFIFIDIFYITDSIILDLLIFLIIGFITISMEVSVFVVVILFLIFSLYKIVGISI